MNPNGASRRRRPRGKSPANIASKLQEIARAPRSLYPTQLDLGPRRKKRTPQLLQAATPAKKKASPHIVR